jgi:hypothetical protein
VSNMTLDQAQRQRFESLLAPFKLGLEHAHTSTLSTMQCPVVHSSDPDVGPVKRHIINVESLDDIRRLFRVTPRLTHDRGYGRLKAWNTGEVASASELSKAQVQHLYRGALAYAFGHSDDSSFHQATNAVVGPIELSVFAASSIDIYPGNPLVISGSTPVVVVYDTINIHPGGQIQISAAGSLQVNVLNRLAS